MRAFRFVAALSIVLALGAVPALAQTSSLTATWCVRADDAYHLVGGPGSSCPSSAAPLLQELIAPAVPRFLVGRVQAASSTTATLLQATLVNCANDPGSLSTRNHRGSDQDGSLVTWARYLFVPRTTADVDCVLSQRARSFNSSVPDQPLAAAGTFLDMTDDTKPGAATWQQERSVDIGGNKPSEAQVLSGSWTASPQAKSADVMADVELTTCNALSSSCFTWGTTGSGSPSSGSIVETEMRVVQRGADGQPCRTTTWPEGEPLRTRIPNEVRHMKMYHGGVFPIDDGCSRVFDIALTVRLISGNIVAVEPGRYSTAIAMNVAPETPADSGSPRAPQRLSGQPGNRQATLRWADNLEPDLGLYRVYRTADPPVLPSRNWNAIATVNLGEPTFTDAGLTNGVTYYYRVTATDRAGNESAPSTEVSVNARPICPGFEHDPRAQIAGTSGDDFLYGTPGADLICGLGGSDVIRGFDGADMILGGPGTDLLLGGAGADVIVGDTGDDRIDGGAGNDRIYAGDGADVVYGSSDDDVVYGGAGPDRISGGDGNDRLAGEDGSDRIVPGRGADRVWGQAGDERFFAVDGERDVVNGGPGTDDRAELDRRDPAFGVERVYR